MFSNFWVNPTCSPTRASILTGKYGYRTNVKGAGDILSSSELALQKYISDQTQNSYASALIGKWHLSGASLTANPETYGIDYYAGLNRGTLDDYYNWPLSENGSSTTQTKYSTEAFTDLSINWIAQQSKPWFLWLAFNAPHTPFHVPPSNMHSQGNLAPYTTASNPLPYYLAAIEAMDFQIGRLLASMTQAQKDNTIIIFIGDNGTAPQVVQSPYTTTTVKSSIYQGGINTPMFISGNGVSRKGTDNNLVVSTDLFATLAEIAGVKVSTINDSQSFKSLFTEGSTIRKFQYSEMKAGTDDFWAISNGTYKLHGSATGDKKMFNLSTDKYEQNNLLTRTLTLTETNAKTELEVELLSIRK